jgi:hypothetical protein
VGSQRFYKHNASDFLEVVKPERIVFVHLRPVHKFQTTMTFVDHSGKTEITWRMVFESAQPAKLMAFFAEANEQNFDRLEGYLAGMAGAQ